MDSYMNPNSIPNITYFITIGLNKKKNEDTDVWK